MKCVHIFRNNSRHCAQRTLMMANAVYCLDCGRHFCDFITPFSKRAPMIYAKRIAHRCSVIMMYRRNASTTHHTPLHLPRNFCIKFRTHIHIYKSRWKFSLFYYIYIFVCDVWCVHVNVVHILCLIPQKWQRASVHILVWPTAILDPNIKTSLPLSHSLGPSLPLMHHGTHPHYSRTQSAAPQKRSARARDSRQC